MIIIISLPFATLGAPVPNPLPRTSGVLTIIILKVRIKWLDPKMKWCKNVFMVYSDDSVAIVGFSLLILLFWLVVGCRRCVSICMHGTAIISRHRISFLCSRLFIIIYRCWANRSKWKKYHYTHTAFTRAHRAHTNMYIQLAHAGTAA